MPEDSGTQLENKFKVSLRQLRTQPYTSGFRSERVRRDDVVVFDVTPDITETRNVEYKSMNPIHMPGQIYVYGSTSSRTFSLSSVKLISRTIEEATNNMNALWILRSWTMPYFGNRSSTLDEKQIEFRRNMEGVSAVGRKKFIETHSLETREMLFGRELLGKPPEVLFLNAYSDVPAVGTGDGGFTRQFQTNIDNVPVVIQSLAIPYPSDVDYIPTYDGQPIPRVMVLDIQLLETRAPREFSNTFSLSDYKKGVLRGF